MAVNITDPNLASKYNQAVKAVNDRLKRIAQLQSEIATYKQQMAAAEEQAMRQQQQQLQQSQENQEKPQEQPVEQTSESFMPSLSDYLSEDYDEVDLYADPEFIEQAEEDYSMDTFYIMVTGEEPEDGTVVAKVYKEDPDSHWYVRDIIGEEDWLDDLVFEGTFDKLEIINYLAEIFGDVQEIDEDTYNEFVDEKEELDDEFYEEELNLD